MAWTQANLDSVDAAIIKLAEGKRVSRHDVGMKERSLEPVTIRQLIELRKEIVADLAVASEISGGRRVSTTVKSDTW